MNLHVLGISAVCIPASCSKTAAEVLGIVTAEVTCSACGVDPSHTHPVAFTESAGIVALARYFTHDLMPRHNGKPRWRCSALDLVKLSVTDSACLHPDQKLISMRNRFG